MVPAYRSHATLGAALAGLAAQSFPSYEVIVVDSSPAGDEATRSAELVRRLLPAATLVRSPQRLLPQAARNAGAGLARGELLAFTDPDVYAPPAWLSALVAAHAASGDVVAGALACHGRRWLDRGIHLGKFSKWLPGGPPRCVDVAPTANLLLPRALFAELGGFRGDMMMGDASFSWELRRRGHRLRLAPEACVEHHHLHSLRSVLRERAERGALYAALRLAAGEGRGSGPLVRLAVVPPRLLSNLLHTTRHAWWGGQLGWLALTLPVVAAAHAAALAGEAIGYTRALRAPPAPAGWTRRSTPPPTPVPPVAARAARSR